MINAGLSTTLDVIGAKISDHYPIISDGIICWNIWAPGTENGFGLKGEELEAIARDPALNSPQNIVKIRLDKTINHLIALIKELGGENIDAICLQEVPDNDKNPHIKKYFLKTLKDKLDNEGLDDFSFSLEKGMPKSENNKKLMANTQTSLGKTSFGNLTLINKSKYELESATSLEFEGELVDQSRRIFETVLEPKNPALGSRRIIWNGHIKSLPKQAHHPHVKAIIERAAKKGATIAADTNVRIKELTEQMSFIEKKASAFADLALPLSGNRAKNGKLNYVDAIITPQNAPHLKWGKSTVKYQNSSSLANKSGPNQLKQAIEQPKTLTPHASQVMRPRPHVLSTQTTIKDLIHYLQNNKHKENHHIKSVSTTGLESPPAKVEMTMNCSKDNSSKNIKVYAEQTSPNGNIQFLMDKVADKGEMEIAIARICKLAVDSAKPGTKLQIPENSPHKEMTKKYLEIELAERCKREGLTYRPRELKVQEQKATPNNKRQPKS